MASFSAAGEEEDFDEDDFILGNEDVLDDEKPRLLGPVNKGPNSNTNRRHVQNGFGVPLPSQMPNKDMRSTEDFQAAAMRGHTDVVEQCLQQGMNVDEVLKCGWTALMYAANSSNPKLVRFLLDKGANPNFDKDFYTVLMSACSSTRELNNSILECVQALVDAGADVNVRDRYHVSPLMCAAREGHVTVMDYLIGKGAELNRQDSRGWTAMSWAASKGHLKAVKLLLDKGADRTLKHSDGQRAVDIALNDEMACLVEGKPYVRSVPKPVVMNGHTVEGGEVLGREQKQRVRPPPPEGDLIPVDKPVDERYGELEVFLYGLEVGHLIPLFRDQHVDFFNFLRFNEQDLINMGITQIGVRKKLLDAIEVVHKKEWDTSSLISRQYNKHIGCPDAIAMVANISKHLRYIGSTVVYVREQIRTHPQILNDARDGTGPRQLHKHTQDASKNLDALAKEISRLHSRLNVEMKRLNIDPPDLVLTSSKARLRCRSRVMRLMSVSMVATVAAVLWWKRDVVLEQATSLIKTSGIIGKNT
ncbi:ankyrin repeat, SAM and basic leucine zipper domain-containing protein 1-like [Haliotis rufescens]|uniref:ankyrin repeat, SAM and basic leucine zipper domain-containing protein 1-like n=1 Tax=Haliotis rufescens TaxID=6454 RepID=UPI00201E8B4C|nr:ankyrin repeat, SAM and basic leucine zipper domain-containing protein 1-like [Haliotis rufescens]